MMIAISLLILILSQFAYTATVSEERDLFQGKLKNLLQRVSAEEDFKAMKEKCHDAESIALGLNSDCVLFKLVEKLQEDRKITTTTESSTVTEDLIKVSQSDFKIGSMFPIRAIQIPKPKTPVTAIHKPIVKHRIHSSKTVISTETPQTTAASCITTVEKSTAHDSPLVKLLIDGQHIEHVQLEIFGLTKAGYQIVSVSKELIENQQ